MLQFSINLFQCTMINIIMHAVFILYIWPDKLNWENSVKPRSDCSWRSSVLRRWVLLLLIHCLLLLPLFVGPLFCCAVLIVHIMRADCFSVAVRVLCLFLTMRSAVCDYRMTFPGHTHLLFDTIFNFITATFFWTTTLDRLLTWTHF